MNLTANKKEINLGELSGSEAMLEVKIASIMETFLTHLKGPKVHDVNKGLYVNLIKIGEFHERFNIYFRITILKNDSPYITNDGVESVYNHQGEVERDKKNKCVTIYCRNIFNINYKKLCLEFGKKPRGLKNMGIVFEIMEPYK